MRHSAIFPLRNLQTELDSMFQHFPFQAGISSRWSPHVDTHETEDAYLVVVDLPGVPSEDVTINLDKGVLTVRGERKSPFGLNSEAKPPTNGKFEHSFPVPETVDTESIDATYKDGVMTITLRKAEASQPRQIQITVA